MPQLPKLLTAILLGISLLPLISCGASHDTDEKYVLVSDNLQIPYWQTAAAGFAQSASPLLSLIHI